MNISSMYCGHIFIKYHWTQQQNNNQTKTRKKIWKLFHMFCIELMLLVTNKHTKSHSNLCAKLYSQFCLQYTIFYTSIKYYDKQIFARSLLWKQMPMLYYVFWFYFTLFMFYYYYNIQLLFYKKNDFTHVIQFPCKTTVKNNKMYERKIENKI